MLKRFYLLLILLCIVSFGFAQQDSIKHYHKHKQRASPYDTNATYFNKWKLNFDFDIGAMNINPFITGQGNIPGTFGLLNQQYNESILPSFNLSANYGITEKSAIGAIFTFQQTNFNPATPSPGLTSGDIPMFSIEARYLHCLRSWKHFYYGFEYGVIVYQNNTNSNTFTECPIILPVFIQDNIGFLFGMRIPIAKNLWLHYEIQEILPLNITGAFPLVNEQFGFNYAIDTRKNYHKPVKADPVLVSDSLKRYYLKVEDSARARNKRLNLAYDSTNIPPIPFDTIGEKRKKNQNDNTGKLNISLQSGNGDMDVVAQSMFGTVSSGYNQTLLPLFSLCADYGWRKKSDLGVDLTYMQVDYTPSLPDPNLTRGNTSAYLIEARYLHCMWSWRYFYYGFKLGAVIWNPEFNSNTFYNPPKNPQPLVGVSAGALLGVHVTIVKNLLAQMELVFTGPITYADYGITYRFNTHKKPVKTNSYYIPPALR